MCDCSSSKNLSLYDKIITGVVKLASDEQAVSLVFDKDYLAKLLFSSVGMRLNSESDECLGGALLQYHMPDTGCSIQVHGKVMSNMEFIPALLAEYCKVNRDNIEVSNLVEANLALSRVLTGEDIACIEKHFDSWCNLAGNFNIKLLPVELQNFVHEVVSTESKECLKSGHISNGASIKLIMEVITKLNYVTKPKLYKSILDSVITTIEMVLPCSGLKFDFYSTFESFSDSIIILGKNTTIDLVGQIIFHVDYPHTVLSVLAEGVDA